MASSQGVIAAGHDVTAQAGEDILRGGGNAYDAALAALAAACVAEPVLASMAGGGFMLASPADASPLIYDFFVQTPGIKRPREDLDFYGIMADFGSTQQEFHIGMASAAVPGQVLGMFEIHKDLCSMPMKDIFAPAIKYAKEGVETNNYQSNLFSVVQEIYISGAELKATFGSRKDPNRLVLPGEIVKRPELADFLDVLASEGPDLFYRGEIAQQIDRDMKEGGLLTQTDMAAYQVEKRKALTLKYKDVLVEMNPAPSAGGTLVALGLKLLEDQALQEYTPGSAEHIGKIAHVLDKTLEARLALESVDQDQREATALDENFLAQYRNDIGTRPKARRGTTHLSVIDKDGNMAGVTVSNGEGCDYVVPGTGVIMNNMMGEEDVNPGFYNWAPNTRMSSMMNPSALLWPDGKRVSLGTGGSNRIRSALLQLIINLIEFQMDVTDAVALPRIHMEEDMLYIEGGFKGDFENLLNTYPGHLVFDDYNMFFGGTHVAEYDGKTFHGAGDPRRAGVCHIL